MNMKFRKRYFLTLIVYHDFDVILHRLRRFQNNLKYLKCFIFYIFNVKKSLHGNISKLHTKDKKKTLSCILISIKRSKLCIFGKHMNEKEL